MRILLDECAPRPFRDALMGYDVLTVPEMGWAGKKNGELLSLMSQSGFDALLTTERNLKYQQNLTAYQIMTTIMMAISNRLGSM